ncbi:hypothetical protein AK812_SmicGene4663 [Symbiodinium microadriaticum]|uniref:Reverse transcriptase domain-containing protein n=1 Tax=Symbiodinium microadriaticum TaxID=2951 RepID=A0A1Q9EVN7_SYMMI|nr:hypothetical protein AK812_SmicGene4663 [Symbiodinium microadriaticum]
MRPRVRAKQRTGTGRQGRHDHTFARVFGEGPRSMVLPTVRPVSGAGVRCKGGAAAFEERVPRGAVASTPVQQEATSIRRFRAAACGFPRLGFEKLDVASCGQRPALRSTRHGPIWPASPPYATGDMFRRLVSETLAREWAVKFDQATRPFQFALQARAGTDALAAHVRAALETRPDAVLVAPELPPFVRLFSGSPSTYCWPRTHSDVLHPDDTLVAFLDDLYVITSPSRAKAALDVTVRAVEDRCGIASNLSKTRVIAAEAGPGSAGHRGAG